MDVAKFLIYEMGSIYLLVVITSSTSQTTFSNIFHNLVTFVIH